MQYAVKSSGIETVHQKDFCHELPGGFDCWVFLQLVTPHLLNEKDTSLVVADSGTCVLYTPGHPRYLYCAPGWNELRNNFIHFKASDDARMLEKVQNYQIPVNTFFRLRKNNPVLSTLSELIYEHSVDQPNRDEMIDHLIEVLLIQIARNTIPWDAPEDITQSRNFRTLESLRKEMYASPERDWSVKGMASSAFLSENRFILLYRRFFDTTPRQDLMRARILKAKSFMNKDSAIRDIALSCGFKNEYYFSNAFKKMVGMSPSQYMKSVKESGPFPER